MKKLYSLEGKWPNLPFYSFSKNSQKTFLILLLMFSVGFASAQSFVVNDLKYTIINPTEVSVSKDGACPTGELTIPSLVTDPNSSIEYSVRTIEANAFAGCSALTSVILGDSITTIATNGFRVCNSLTSIDLPNSLTTIGITAFESVFTMEKRTNFPKIDRPDLTVEDSDNSIQHEMPLNDLQKTILNASQYLASKKLGLNQLQSKQKIESINTIGEAMTYLESIQNHLN